MADVAARSQFLSIHWLAGVFGLGRKPIAIDLFCGVGGMSLGFRQAGFSVRGAVDRDQRHTSIYLKNFPGARVANEDISQLDAADLRKLAGIGNRRVDVLFGGPPCQGFSVGGVRNPADARNDMIFEFARLVRELKPRYFVMENVGGLLSGRHADRVKSFLLRVRRAGFQVITPLRTLNAADYGVPQRRSRVFVIGYDRRLACPEYPHPWAITDENGSEYSPTVLDAIGDLPDVDRLASLFDKDGYEGSLGRPSHYAKLLRGEAKESGDRYSARARTSALMGCLRTRHDPKIVARFARTPLGARDPVSRFVKLDPDAKAPTLRAGTTIEFGKHTAPRPIHPTRPRCITVREAARLHGFPDWFRFHETRWHAFRQIGNSVPPRLARAVALQLLYH